MIALNCPQCDEKLVLKDEMAGRRFTCPDCEVEFKVPADDDEEPIIRRSWGIRRFVVRHWEILGCIGVCLTLGVLFFCLHDTGLTWLMPYSIVGTVAYASFYRRLVHPFVGFVTILLLVIAGGKIINQKATEPLAGLTANSALGGSGAPISGDMSKMLQDTFKNLSELKKEMDKLYENK